ncbi:hypothetical protein [Psychrobacillus psychrodurans]|uniref:hypothetical protein n=1 Tax=Psychrobacillus psychrodurans TaxID=126157 RepID=UPI003D039433
MGDFKEFVLKKLEVLHLKLNCGNKYDLHTTKGLTERIEDLAKYEQLSEVVRENPDWNSEEFSKELSERIRKKTTLW